MGLDFGIEKRRKGKNYEGLKWEDTAATWRNCHEVKRIFSETIDFGDGKECGGYYPISLGAMQILIKKLAYEASNVNFSDLDDVDTDATNKLFGAIADLSQIVREALWDYTNGIEYEYRVFDSF